MRLLCPFSEGSEGEVRGGNEHGKLAVSSINISRFLPMMLSVGWLSAVILLVTSPLAVSAEDDADSVASSEPSGERIYRYNVCNGLSNQLIYHAASIAEAVNSGYEHVEIPDYFILDGVQTSEDFVLPTAQNSAAFGYIFDQEYFVQVLERDVGIHAKFVRFELGDNTDALPCKGMGGVSSENSRQMSLVMDAFRPSRHVQPIIDEFLKRMPGTQQDGVCLHHRDGQDWHDHCGRWSGVRDGVYRGNCLLNPKDKTILKATKYRALEQPGRWIYYCGDHEIPQEFLDAVGHSKNGSQAIDSSLLTGISSRHTILNQASSEQHNSLSQLLATHANQTHTMFDLAQHVAFSRDFWALIDFFLCRNLPRFVGNSVSTFSALQIAMRQGQGAYWYNSQYIPLARFWRAFSIPIVYTYTEASAETGRQLLKASIDSVRKNMPSNPIHILYHGNEDARFQKWLKDSRVIIHNHEPAWADQIEQMRLNGNKSTSHLFEHKGNYMGTWQRIDIPHFIESEYALLLDADTIIKTSFSIADFTNEMTFSIAMSSERETRPKKPSNAGVLLMNIPYLRKTYKAFLKHILKHVKTGGKFNNPAPSDQGAYLSFYADTVQFLRTKFNRKPYIPMGRQPNNPFIFHFHGPKPSHYFQHMLGREYTPIFRDFCAMAFQKPRMVCRALSCFAQSSMSADRTGYCCAAFEGDAGMISACQVIMEKLAKDDACESMDRFFRTFERVKSRLAITNSSTLDMSRLCPVPPPISIKPDGSSAAIPTTETIQQQSGDSSSYMLDPQILATLGNYSSNWNDVYYENAASEGQWFRLYFLAILSSVSIVLIAKSQNPDRRRTLILMTIFLISLSQMFSLCGI